MMSTIDKLYPAIRRPIKNAEEFAARLNDDDDGWVYFAVKVSEHDAVIKIIDESGNDVGYL